MNTKKILGVVAVLAVASLVFAGAAAAENLGIEMSTDDGANYATYESAEAFANTYNAVESYTGDNILLKVTETTDLSGVALTVSKPTKILTALTATNAATVTLGTVTLNNTLTVDSSLGSVSSPVVIITTSNPQAPGITFGTDGKLVVNGGFFNALVNKMQGTIDLTIGYTAAADNGTVLGDIFNTSLPGSDVAFAGSLTVAADATLTEAITIGSGATLTVNDGYTLTNSNTINLNGAFVSHDYAELKDGSILMAAGGKLTVIDGDGVTFGNVADKIKKETKAGAKITVGTSEDNTITYTVSSDVTEDGYVEVTAENQSKGTNVKLNFTSTYTFSVPSDVVLKGTVGQYNIGVVEAKSTAIVSGKYLKVTLSGVSPDVADTNLQVNNGSYYAVYNLRYVDGDENVTNYKKNDAILYFALSAKDASETKDLRFVTTNLDNATSAGEYTGTLTFTMEVTGTAPTSVITLTSVGGGQGSSSYTITVDTGSTVSYDISSTAGGAPLVTVTGTKAGEEKEMSINSMYTSQSVQGVTYAGEGWTEGDAQTVTGDATVIVTFG